MKRFRVYLKDKYRVSNAYCFLGAYMPNLQDMYTAFQKYGYILIFREHGYDLIGSKKGNVDTDIVFHVMRELIEDSALGKIVIVSGDGDYKRMIDYLIDKNRFAKILLPNKDNASSLYKSIADEYRAFLDTPAMRLKVGYKTKK